MSGSSPHDALPPVQVNSGGISSTIDSAGNLITRVGGMSPQSAQTAAGFILTLVICGLVVFQLWDSSHRQADTLAIVVRSMESESEKNRAATSAEFQRNRDAFAAEGKANRESFADGVKMTIASHQKLSIELGKLEQVVSGLSGSLAELRRKLPPQEEDVCVTAPRLKADGKPDTPPP